MGSVGTDAFFPEYLHNSCERLHIDLEVAHSLRVKNVLIPVVNIFVDPGQLIDHFFHNRELFRNR